MPKACDSAKKAHYRENRVTYAASIGSPDFKSNWLQLIDVLRELVMFKTSFVNDLAGAGGGSRQKL